MARHAPKTNVGLRWVLIVAAASSLILGAGWWQLHRILQRESFHRDVQNFLSAQTGWTITFGEARVLPLPRLHLNIKDVDIQIPHTGRIRVAAVQLYPQFLSLAWGKFRLAKIIIVSPQIRLAPTTAPKPEGPAQSFFTVEFEQRLLPAFARLSGYLLHGLILVQNGAFVLASDQHAPFSLDQLQARLTFPSRGLGIDLTALEGARHTPVAFSGVLTYTPGRLSVSQAAGAYPPSYFSDLSGHFDWQGTPGVWITSGKTALGINVLVPLLSELAKRTPWLRDLSSQSLSLRISSASLTGPWSDPARWQIEAAGVVDNLLLQSGRLPGEMRLQGGVFALHDRTFALRQLRVKFPDSALLISGDLFFPPGAAPRGALAFSGELGAATLQQLGTVLAWPPAFRLQGPLKISTAKISWNQTPEVVVNADLGFPRQLRLTLAGSWSPSVLNLERLNVLDASGSAALTCRATDQAFDLAWRGLTSDTVYNKIFLLPAPPGLTLGGDFRLHAEKNNLQAFSARGNFRGAHWLLNVLPGLPVKIGSVDAVGRGGWLDVRVQDLVWGETRLSALGEVKPQGQAYSANLTVTAQSLDVDNLINTVNALSDAVSASANAAAPAEPWQLAFNIFSQKTLFDGYVFSPVQAHLLVAPLGNAHTVDVNIDSANLGGMTASGKVHVENSVISLDVVPTAAHQDLQVFLNSLTPQPPHWTGGLDISGHITGRGKTADLVNSLQGFVNFKATHGRIYNFTFLSQILSLINVSEILVGTLPGLGKSGVSYSDFSLKGNLHDGAYQLGEAVLKADNMDITGKGNIGLDRGNLNVVVLVAPFKTANRIIDFLPVVNYLFNNHLLAFPIAVKGTLKAPETTFTALSIDEGIFGIMKRTLLLPVYLVSPLLPKSRPAAAPATVTPTAQDR